jgi:hypothetical protein
MKANWKPVSHEPSGVTRYKRSSPRAQAEIHRQENSLSAEMKTGLFGLGTHVGACFMDTSLSDEAVLSKLDQVAHPPRFQDWKAQGEGHYQGKAGRSKVEAQITRSGEEAKVVAHVGHFGTHVEGVFFAPAPSDQEILRRISRPT